MILIRKCRRFAIVLVGLWGLMGCASGGGAGNGASQSGPDPKPVLIRMHACTAASQPGLHEAKAHASRGARDFVAWYNGTSSAITITFKGAWPFGGSGSDIVVQPGETSSWYRVDRNATKSDHEYGMNPSVHPCPDEGPGEPGVVVDD